MCNGRPGEGGDIMSGWSCGSRYKVEMTFRSLMRWWEKPRRRSTKVAHETTASYDGDDGLDSFTISHYQTDIVRIRPEAVELIWVYPSQVTRDRINVLLPKPWRVWSDTEVSAVLVYCE